MSHRVELSLVARSRLDELGKRDHIKLRRVQRCLGMLEENPRHPGLRSHKYESLPKAHGQDIWESYVENRTPGAYRVFWHYGPAPMTITIVDITPHP